MFGLRRTAINVKVMRRFAHAAPAASEASSSAYNPIFQSYHLGRSVDLKQVEGLFDLKKTNGNGSVSFATSAPGSGFDVYGYGSVVFYNSSQDFHRATLATINSLELTPADAVNAMEGYNFECSAMVGHPMNNSDLSTADQKKLMDDMAVTVEKNRPAGLALAQFAALDFVDVALDRIIENISSLDEAGLNSAVKHLAGVMGTIDARAIPKFDDATNTVAYHEMRKWGGVDEQYKELDFKLAVLTKQYNITL